MPAFEMWLLVVQKYFRVLQHSAVAMHLRQHGWLAGLCVAACSYAASHVYYIYI